MLNDKPINPRHVWTWQDKAGVNQSHTPRIPPAFVADLCKDLLDEERRELDDAIAAQDLLEIADALGDMIYILIGTAYKYGIPIGAVFEEICRSNDSKFGPNGDEVLRRADGKILKHPTWSPPDIHSILYPRTEPE